jgi:hypothetical protein
VPQRAAKFEMGVSTEELNKRSTGKNKLLLFIYYLFFNQDFFITQQIELFLSSRHLLS